jgi:hypothetical protein
MIHRPSCASSCSLGLLLAGSVHAETWRFAVIGDTPYSAYERSELPRMLDDIAAEHPGLIVHAGDFKDSRTVCSDELFRDRRALFDASRVPLLYVPLATTNGPTAGNCRPATSTHSNAAEAARAVLRRTALAGKADAAGRTAGRLIPRSTCAGALARCSSCRSTFPGPNNHFGMGSTPSGEYLARNPVLIDWLRQGFAVARREQAAGIVIVMQANPGFKHHAAGLTHAGYRDLLETLRMETLAFPGQVLLVHGDTHWQRIDQPLRHPKTKLPISNFTRLETFGYPVMGWVKVIIDDQLPQLFRFEVRPYHRR